MPSIGEVKRSIETGSDGIGAIADELLPLVERLLTEQRAMLYVTQSSRMRSVAQANRMMEDSIDIMRGLYEKLHGTSEDMRMIASTL